MPFPSTPEWDSTSKYRMETRDLNGLFITTLSFMNLQMEFVLNAPDTIRFDIDLHDPKATQQFLSAGNHEVWLYRNNTLIFAGPLWDVTASSKEARIHCIAESLESWLHVARVTQDLVYTNKQTDEIAWDLIVKSQAVGGMDRRITRGRNDVTSTHSAKIKRSQGAIIYDLITQYTTGAAIGFDWEITPLRVFNVWAPRRNRVGTTLLEFGGSIADYSVQYMGKYVANDVLITGPKGKPTYGVNAGSIAAYHRQQRTVPFPTAKTQAAVNALMTQELQMRAKVRLIPQVVLRNESVRFFEGDLQLGDNVHVRIVDGYVNFDEVQRVVSIQVTVSELDQDVYVMTMNDLREVQ